MTQLINLSSIFTQMYLFWEKRMTAISSFMQDHFPVPHAVYKANFLMTDSLFVIVKKTTFPMVGCNLKYFKVYSHAVSGATLFLLSKGWLMIVMVDFLTEVIDIFNCSHILGSLREGADRLKRLIRSQCNFYQKHLRKEEEIMTPLHPQGKPVSKSSVVDPRELRAQETNQKNGAYNTAAWVAGRLLIGVGTVVIMGPSTYSYALAFCVGAVPIHWMIDKKGLSKIQGGWNRIFGNPVDPEPGATNSSQALRLDLEASVPDIVNRNEALKYLKIPEHLGDDHAYIKQKYKEVIAGLEGKIGQVPSTYEEAIKELIKRAQGAYEVLCRGRDGQ
jgi:hypothetical protein